MATYSASDIDNAVVSCFFELQDIAHDPRLKILHEELFLSSKAHAQSLLEKPNNLHLKL